jgi:hypothetical protein
MKKRYLLLFLSSFFITHTIAQTTDSEALLKKQAADTADGWKKGGMYSLNFSQASFTNWAAGGQNSFALNTLLNVFANYKKGNATWDNMLDIGYGLQKQGTNAPFLKTDDKIDLVSKYGQRAKGNWYYAGLMNFKTQMAPGYNYPDDSTKISNLFAPAYLLFAIGMDYKYKDKFTAFIAPLTSKNTIVNDPTLSAIGAFGVDPGKTIRYEFGGYVRLMYTDSYFKDKSVSIVSKLDLFSNYLDRPGNIDISWENIFGFKVNKYITATITTHLIYDHDITIGIDTNNDGVFDASGPRTQFKQVLGIGFSYKF